MNINVKKLSYRASELLGLAALVLGGSSAAFAKNDAPADGKSSVDDDGFEDGFDAEISAAGTYADRSREGFDDVDSSNVRLRGEVGYEGGDDMTKFRLETHVAVSDYRGDNDGTRLGWGIRAEATQAIGKAASVEISAGHVTNTVVLESLRADQTKAETKFSIKQGSKTIDAHAGYRWRDYKDSAGGKGKGWEAGARIHHRFGSYNWVAASVSHDRIKSAAQRRSYQRTSFAADYSVPVAKRLRLLASAEHRNWTYQGRFVGDVAGAAKRKDTLTRPEIGLSYGRTKGVYVRGTAGYDFYKSNDARFSGNGPRAQMTIGFRF